MDNFRLERLDRKEGEIYVHELSTDKDQPTALNEFDLVRLCSNLSQKQLNVFIGNLKLQRFKQNDQFVYSLTSSDDTYFSQLFLNNFGFISIEIWENSERVSSFFVQIKSTKISFEEQKLWFEKIQSVFPITNLEFDFAPMSNVKVDFSNAYGFFNFSSFANELQDFLTQQIKNFERPGFLKIRFSSRTQISNDADIDQAKQQLWTSSSMLWKQTKPSQFSLVKKNFRAFEPVKYPSKKTDENYNTDLNRRLLLRLIEVSILLQKFLHQCKETDIKNLDLRSQFDTSESKFNLIQIIRNRLQISNEITGELILKLEKLGVKSVSSEISNDSRFGELTQNIMKIECFLMPLRKLSLVHKSLVTVPSNDLLFEYFSYAVMVEAIKSLGFVVCDIGDGAPVPFYMKFIRKVDGVEISIFYDQTIPKIGRDKYFHPLVDKNKSSSFKRPDFIFHIQSNGFDSVFVADAKFKKLKKCLKDNFGTKLNSDHIVGKYSSGISQLGDFGRPPFFILGICLADNTDNEVEYHSSLHDKVQLFTKKSPLVQAGAIALGYGSDLPLATFFSEAVDFHKILSDVMPQSDALALHKPEQEKKGPSTGLKHSREEQESLQTWHHKAPTLNENDAAEIKGMLLRGDKPQDIAFYFGVNNGRISEIKSGTKFMEVVPKKQELPPPGPYPAIRDLI